MGGSKPPGPSDQQQEAQALQIKLLKQQLEDAEKPIELPQLKIPKPPAPPVLQTSKDAEAAALEARQRALSRTNAGRGTLFAGETGNYKPKSTLLG